MIKARAQFGKKLKEHVLLIRSKDGIGRWAFSYYFNEIPDTDLEFRELVLSINKMELGAEFSISYEKLGEAADELMLGRVIKL